MVAVAIALVDGDVALWLEVERLVAHGRRGSRAFAAHIALPDEVALAGVDEDYLVTEDMRGRADGCH